MSPILFLYFIAELLPLMDTPNSSASGFVDDTNILTWSRTTEENCRKLEELHAKCETWAGRHGVKFSPSKYSLIHFSRARGHNMEAAINIQGHHTDPSKEVRILGLWITPKLSWGAHVKRACQRAEANMQSISRLTTSTWGATFTQARQMYSAIVRPALTYGSQIWATDQPKTGKPPAKLIKEISKVQQACLRKVTGAYKSVPLRALEHEANILPMDLYVRQLRIQHAALTANQSCQKFVRDQIEEVATSSSTRRIPQRELDIVEWEKRTGIPVELNLFRLPSKPTKEEQKAKRARIKALQSSICKTWKDRWDHQATQRTRHQTAAQPRKWNASVQRSFSPQPEPHQTIPTAIHRTLTRVQSSIATQLRTEHMGLNSYLKWRRVPGVDSANCPCGYFAQNTKHMLLYCPQWAEGRGDWLRQARRRDIFSLLSNDEDVDRITHWISRKRLIDQFRLGPDVEAEITRREEKKRRLSDKDLVRGH